MTVKFLHFAVKPRVCDVCHRRFILEPYEIEGGFSLFSGVVERVVCTRCRAKAQKKENTDADE